MYVCALIVQPDTTCLALNLIAERKEYQSHDMYIYIYIYRSEYHTQLAKMSFDKIFDLTAGVYFNIYSYNIYIYISL